MKYIKSYNIFESKSEDLIKEFKEDFGTELDENFDTNQIKLLRKAFELFDKKFIKNKIKKIILKDLGGVHGKWKDTPKKKQMTLNPSIFKFEKEFENGVDDLPYKLFVIVHEIGHCVDHLEKVSFSKKWQAISGWKRCDRDKVIPEGYDRYIEKRKGREAAGHKKSNWVYKEGSDFIRKYSSRNPREDFADSFAFGVFGHWHRFEGDGGKKKMEIIKSVLNKVD